METGYLQKESFYTFTEVKTFNIAKEMTTVIIDDSDVMVEPFITYARTLPFTTVIDEKKQSFEAAVAECNGHQASGFFDELRRQVKEHFQHA
jgi:hypothetical protein